MKQISIIIKAKKHVVSYHGNIIYTSEILLYGMKKQQ